MSDLALLTKGWLGLTCCHPLQMILSEVKNCHIKRKVQPKCTYSGKLLPCPVWMAAAGWSWGPIRVPCLEKMKGVVYLVKM